MSTNFCPNCGSPNAAQARFCAQCGQTLSSQPVAAQGPASPPACPRCHTPIRTSARFCQTCGYDLMQQQVPAGPPPGGQLVRVPNQPPGQGTPKPPPQATQYIGSSAAASDLIVRWMGGNSQHFPLSKPVISVGRAPDNDVVINHPAVSGHHLSLAISPTSISVTDLNSTNGTQLNGQRIPPNQPQAMRPGDVLRLGDLTGNWVTLAFAGESGEPVRMLSLGKLDLTNLTSVVIGRDPKCWLPLNHPTVSYQHATIFKQNGGLAIRDMGSTNGTYVNGKRMSQVPLQSGDEIQIGPFKLAYDAQQQSLANSMRLGHRIDAIQLGREVAKKRMILKDVSLTIQPGEFVAFVGGSGAGKSTLMKAMNGYDPANHGQLLLDGEPLYSKLDMYRTQMGYVPQDDIIHKALPVRLAMYYAAKLRLPDARPSEIRARIQDALRAVEMEEHADKPVKILSGGQRKRVSIAVELLARPSLFFLDEPTSGLDPGLEKKMMYDLNRIADEGRTVILVTHATANIEQCDNVAFLSQGRLAFYGPPNDALKFYDVRDFSDIYIKLSQDVDPAKGKPVPPELMPYYQQRHSPGKLSAGVLWADHYRQSPYFKQYVADRQSKLGKAGKAAIAAAAPPGRRVKVSFIGQMIILARRYFDLIRLDLRTLFILLLMIPLIAALFGAVSTSYAFKGKEAGTYDSISSKFKLKLKNVTPGSKEATIEFLPVADASLLVTMLALALTQGGTFVAAYEIVKERTIYRRERAVNLSVFAYVLSKVIVLAGFAVIMVASAFLVLWLLGIDLSVRGAVFPDHGTLEMYITLYLGVLASIMFGLAISAIVPSTDVVLYAILIQLFVQIILGGALFPVTNETVMKGTIAYWTTVGLGSTVNLPALNDIGMVCTVTLVDNPMQPGQKDKYTDCSSSKTKLEPGGTETNKAGDYSHTPQKIYDMWTGLIVYFVVCFIITIVVISRQKGD